jgi:hypothetical protein
MAERQKYAINSLYIDKIYKLLPADDVDVMTRLDFSNITPDTTNHVAGLLIKAGTSASPVTADIANGRFIDLYFDNGATSGDNRGVYLRLYLTGAGGGGEAARVFTTVSNVAAGTAHGMHVSLSFGTSGSITGLGAGLRSTLSLPNDVTISAGTYTGGMSEVYFEGDNSSTTDISGATAHSIHRFVVDGDTTARAKIQNAFEFVNIPSGTSTHMLKTDMHTGTPTDGLRILINDAVYYISLVSA